MAQDYETLAAMLRGPWRLCASAARPGTGTPVRAADGLRTCIGLQVEGLAYNRPMTQDAQTVLAEALRLDVSSRAQVAAELLGSLDGPADPGAEAAWAAEIERRVSAIKAGTVKLEAWEDVRRRIERDILNR